MKWLHLSAVALLTVALAGAQTVTGRWTGSFSTADNGLEIVVALNQAADGTITGYILSPRSTYTITSGKAEGNGVTLEAERAGRGGAIQKVTYTATVEGGKMKLTLPAPQGALPTDTYTNFSKIRLQGRVANLRHIANAHTDGDTYVWFKTANVLSTGDTFTNGRYPNIDFANGGNIKGMIAATDAYLKLTNAKSRIVPGHGPIADKAALTEYRAMLITARDRMAALVKQGKSEDDVVAAAPFADLDKKWAPTELASKNFIRVVYHSLADKPDKKSLLKRMLRRG